MNKDYKRRDEILFGGFRKERYELGGCARCDMPYDKFKQLYDEGFIDPDENQNSSPTTKEFMHAVLGCEKWVEFEAYAISPDRDDYRITIEGIDIWIPLDKREDLCRFVEEFHYADEFSLDTDENGFHLRAWWD